MRTFNPTNFNQTKTRAVAVATGGVLMASAVFHPAPAQAVEKNEKTYKAGAAVLGVLGAYFILKGKTVPGAIAGAGAYYAYKKSKDAKNNDRDDDDRYSDNRYPDNDDFDNRYSDNSDRYPDGSWSTPASRTNRRADNSYPDYSTSSVASSNDSQSGGSAVVLK